MTPDTTTRPANDARHSLDVKEITIRENRLRAVQENAVATLAESMALIGQRVPITVRQTPGPGGDDASGGFVVVAGAHRLLAAKRLGWERIDATCLEGDETEARLWEIAENLHRAELKVLERAEHLAEWVRLVEVRQAGEAGKPAQLAQLSATGGRGKEGGLSAATRTLGVSRREGQRALKIDALDPAAKAVARELGLDRNQAALLAAAKEADADAQVAALRGVARRKRAEARSTEAGGGEAGDAGPAPGADQAGVAQDEAGEDEARAEPAGEGDGEEGRERAIARLARELVAGLPEPRRRALRALLADERARELLIGRLRGELAEPAEETAAPANSPGDFGKTGAA